ncbi:MAG: hypothetical protein JJW01_02415 [Alphaproteobacteria bacterium]|nr:hypothetical protein [Rickettsiales bacterium]
MQNQPSEKNKAIALPFRDHNPLTVEEDRIAKTLDDSSDNVNATGMQMQNNSTNNNAINSESTKIPSQPLMGQTQKINNATEKLKENPDNVDAFEEQKNTFDRLQKEKEKEKIDLSALKQLHNLGHNIMPRKLNNTEKLSTAMQLVAKSVKILPEDQIEYEFNGQKRKQSFAKMYEQKENGELFFETLSKKEQKSFIDAVNKKNQQNNRVSIATTVTFLVAGVAISALTMAVPFLWPLALIPTIAIPLIAVKKVSNLIKAKQQKGKFEKGTERVDNLSRKLAKTENEHQALVNNLSKKQVDQKAVAQQVKPLEGTVETILNANPNANKQKTSIPTGEYTPSSNSLDDKQQSEMTGTLSLDTEREIRRKARTSDQSEFSYDYTTIDDERSDLSLESQTLTEEMQQSEISDQYEEYNQDENKKVDTWLSKSDNMFIQLDNSSQEAITPIDEHRKETIAKIINRGKERGRFEQETIGKIHKHQKVDKLYENALKEVIEEISPTIKQEALTKESPTRQYSNQSQDSYLHSGNVSTTKWTDKIARMQSESQTSTVTKRSNTAKSILTEGTKSHAEYATVDKRQKIQI